jgi:hypothetical protein
MSDNRTALPISDLACRNNSPAAMSAGWKTKLKDVSYLKPELK